MSDTESNQICSPCKKSLLLIGDWCKFIITFRNLTAYLLLSSNSMGECLIQTLEDTLEEGAITPAAKQAWMETYDALSGDMIRAQKEHRRSSK